MSEDGKSLNKFRRFRRRTVDVAEIKENGITRNNLHKVENQPHRRRSQKRTIDEDDNFVSVHKVKIIN
jgi:hypothetical protein